MNSLAQITKARIYISDAQITKARNSLAQITKARIYSVMQY